jgi:hypothetical protein
MGDPPRSQHGDALLAHGGVLKTHISEVGRGHASTLKVLRQIINSLLLTDACPPSR